MLGEMKVSTRLALAFGLVLALLVGVISLGVVRMAQVNDGLRIITDENMVEMTHANGMRSAAAEVSIKLRNMMLDTDDGKLKSDQAALHKAFASFEASSSALEKKFAAVGIKPLNRVRNSGWKIPQIAHADVVDEISSVGIDGGDARGAI